MRCETNLRRTAQVGIMRHDRPGALRAAPPPAPGRSRRCCARLGFSPPQAPRVMRESGRRRWWRSAPRCLRVTCSMPARAPRCTWCARRSAGEPTPPMRRLVRRTGRRSAGRFIAPMGVFRYFRAVKGADWSISPNFGVARAVRASAPGPSICPMTRRTIWRRRMRSTGPRHAIRRSTWGVFSRAAARRRGGPAAPFPPPRRASARKSRGADGLQIDAPRLHGGLGRRVGGGAPRLDRSAFAHARRVMRPDRRFHFGGPEADGMCGSRRRGPTPAVTSFRAARALLADPEGAARRHVFRWLGSTPPNWSSARSRGAGVIEPGGWF